MHRIVIYTIELFQLNKSESHEPSQRSFRFDAFQRFVPIYHRWSIAQAKGLPIPQMLLGFGPTATTPIKKRVSTILHNLKQGREFHHNDSGCCTEMEITFLDVGFSTGKLDASLTALANIYRADWRSTKRLKGTMIYPMFVGFLGCWILPAPLIMCMGVWFWILISVGLSVAMFSFGGWILLQYFHWLRNRPKAVHSRFFRGLAMALEAGCSFHDALDLAKKIAAPSHLATRLQYVAYNGQPFCEILQHTGCFSQNLIAMVQAGEISGTLPKSLLQISNNLESGFL